MSRLLVFLISLFALQVQAETINIPSGAELIFASNFENSYFVNKSGATVPKAFLGDIKIKGTDNSFSPNSYRTDWDELRTLTNSNLNFLASGTSAADAYAEIINDPFSTGRGKILNFRTNHIGSKSRVQLNMQITENKWTNSILMRVPSESVGLLASYPSAMDWFTVMEMPIDPSFATEDFGTCNSSPVYIQNVDCVPNYRVGLNIVKRSGQLYFDLYGDYAGKFLSASQKAALGVTGAPTNGLTKTDYFHEISSEPVLLDQWFRLNMFYERYPNRTDGLGNLKVQVVNSSGVATTVINLTDVVVTDFINTSRTYGRIKINPFKLYTADYFVEYIFDNNGSNPDRVDVYYDDWRLFKGDATVADGTTPVGSTTPKAPANFTVVQNGTSIDISWDAVTQYTDNTPISGGVITGYDIRTASSNGTGATWTKFVDNQAGTTYSLTPPADGRYCYQAKSRKTPSGSGLWVTEACVDYVADPIPTGGSDPTLVDIYPFSTSGTVNTLSLTPPAPIAANRLAIACYAYRRDANNLTWGGSYGFTQIAQVVGTHGLSAERDPDLRCFSKLTGASEPASYVLSLSGSPNNVEKIHAILAVFSNPDVNAIRDVQTVIANNSTSAVLPALSGGLSNSVALVVGAVWDNTDPPDTATVPAGYTEEANFMTIQSNRFGVMMASVKAASDGTATTATQNSRVASNHVGMHILVSGLQIDTTPNAFTLTDTTGHQNNSPLGALNGACTAAISGLAADTTISISGSIGAEYNIDGGVYTSVPGTVGNGDVVCVRLNASDLYDTDESVSLEIGGVYANYTVTTIPTPPKVLKLGTPLSKITRNGVPANFTYTSVKVYDKNPATDRTAQVLVELVGPYNVGLQEYEGISVVDGIASATEADVLVGSGSLNALDDGTYWVLSSRPSNGTLAISLTNRQLVTE